MYATPRLEATVGLLTERLGVAPSPGGRHTGQGTRNYLLSLGGNYLEIIGPDLEQPPPDAPRPFGLDHLEEPLLAGWSVRVQNIEERVARARARGYDPGLVHPMIRTLPDGRVLEWRLTLRAVDAVPSLIPFLIDWGDTPHPSETATQGARLLGVWGETPEVEETRRILEALEVELEFGEAERPSLSARIRGSRGEMTL